MLYGDAGSAQLLVDGILWDPIARGKTKIDAAMRHARK
jgi:hypothetical protein